MVHFLSQQAGPVNTHIRQAFLAEPTTETGAAMDVDVDGETGAEGIMALDTLSLE